ncbi:neurocalcin-like [Pelomyxa schiedti]|nr:neurocalcin-like [Pelomyxa schiedti]
MGADNVKMSKKELNEYRTKYEIPQDKFAVIVKNFKKHATADGRITRDAFKKILGGVMHDALAEQVFDSFDADGNGYMDLREYLAMMGVTHGGNLDQKLNASFDLFDKDGNGTLSRDEVKGMFVLIIKQKRAAAGQSQNEPLDEKSMQTIQGIVDTVFDRVDTDRSGAIDRQEFIAGFRDHPEICGFFKQF